MSFLERLRANRRFILFLLALGWATSYFDRQFMSIALNQMGVDLHFDAGALGLTMSIFAIGYTVMQLPGGWLADRIGAKRVIVAAIAVWAIFTVLTGLAWSFASIMLIRFFFGIGEGAFPAASAKLMTENFPKESRSRAQSALYVGVAVGSLVSGVLGASLMADIGWRNVYYIFGAVGLVVSLLFAVFLRSSKPSDLREKATDASVGLKSLIRLPVMWLFMLSFFGLQLASSGVMSWLPSYLMSARKVSLQQAGSYTGITSIVTVVGLIVGGLLVDKLWKNRERTIIIATNALAAVCLFLMVTTPSLSLSITFYVVASFLFSLAQMAIWSMPIKLLPTNVMGSAFGLINMGGPISSAIAAAAMGYLIKAFNGSYMAAFWFLILGLIISIIAVIALRDAKAALQGNPNIAKQI